MFLESFQVTGGAVLQIFLLGSIGYLLVRNKFLDHGGLSTLSRLVIAVTLPILIFCRLIKDFKFNLYPDWWIFPLLSILITLAGLVIGAIFALFIKGQQQKLQFLSLVTFQNSGYLPLALVAALFPKEKADALFIYIFLFLFGFNLIIWSAGVYMLTFSKTKRFELGSLFSPPVVTIIFSLLFIYLGWERFIPDALIKSLEMAGDCTLPLALFVVGGNLAEIDIRHTDKKAIFLMSLAKLIILPALGLWLLVKLNLPSLIGLLILIQLAMPPATSLSIIIRHYKKEDLLVSQGIFFGHTLSLITISVFLSLYFTLVVIK